MAVISAYLKSEKASTTLGLTSSHPVIALETRPGKSDYTTTDLSANPPSRYRRCFGYLDCFKESCIRAVSLLSDWMWRSSTDRALVKRETVESHRVATLLRTVDGTFLKAVSIPSEYRGDNVPHSPYQPHSGSYPAGSCGQKVSSRALITALQASKGSGVERDEMTFLGQGLAYPDTT